MRFAACVASLLLASITRAEPAVAVPAPLLTPTSGAHSWARQGAATLLERAQRLEQSGRLTEALYQATRATQLDTAFGEAWLYVAELRERTRDFAEAERVYAQAVRLHSVASEAFARRAALRRRLGDPDRAVHDLSRSLELEPEHAERWRLLAHWYAERRAWPAALGAWRRILSLADPGDTGARREARVQVAALTVLSAETDPVNAPATGWVRRALAHIAAR